MAFQVWRLAARKKSSALSVLQAADVMGPAVAAFPPCFLYFSADRFI
jgi:hypothetical protein